MKRIICILLLIISVFCLVGCNNTYQKEGEQNIQIVEIEKMIMKIDNQTIDITWENNNSVKELFDFAKDGLTINMSKYGGFEQVGSIGKNIDSNNKQMTTSPGDVVLYSGNQIVVFFGSNTWSYTKLGHINLNQTELNNLLNKEGVTLYLVNIC